jgi:hypothetical protein
MSAAWYAGWSLGCLSRSDETFRSPSSAIENLMNKGVLIVSSVVSRVRWLTGELGIPGDVIESSLAPPRLAVVIYRYSLAFCVPVVKLTPFGFE